MSTPNAGNIYVGTGEVWFNRSLNGVPQGWRHLGNVDKLEITPAVTQITKKSSMDAARAILATAITETTSDVSITMSEFDSENLALALLGSTSAQSQTSATVTDAALGTAKQGYYLDTGKIGITVTAVKVSSTSKTLGTDYTVDADSGLIYIVPGGGIADSDTVTWSGSVPTKTLPQVEALTNGTVIGALRFRSSTDAIGPRKRLDVYRLQLVPDGALALLSDNFADIPIKGTVLKDSSRAVGDQYFKLADL